MQITQSPPIAFVQRMRPQTMRRDAGRALGLGFGAGIQKPEGGMTSRFQGAFRASYLQIFPVLIARFAVFTGAAGGLLICWANQGVLRMKRFSPNAFTALGAIS
ncbi:MAG: hypothetical protein ACTTJV_05620 [Ottowia sp.]